MKGKTKKLIRVALPVLLSLLVSCATVPKIKTPPQEFKANLGTIGVVSASFQPEVRLNKPMGKGTAALHFAGKGAGIGLWVAAQGGGSAGPGPFLVVLGFVPLGAAIGSVVGLVKGVPWAEIKEPEKALKSYLATVNFQETMRKRFLSVAMEQTQYPIVPLEVQGPKTPDAEVPYAFLSENGIDTVLEISVRKCELYDWKQELYIREKKRDIDPDLGFRLVAGIKLIRTKDGKVLFKENFVDQRSSSFKFSYWGINEAQPFKEGLDHAVQYLAGLIADRLSRIQVPVDPPPAEELQE
jgi:hypothetical protein